MEMEETGMGDRHWMMAITLVMRAGQVTTWGKVIVSTVGLRMGGTATIQMDMEMMLEMRSMSEALVVDLMAESMVGMWVETMEETEAVVMEESETKDPRIEV